jgi:hypothetical protein
VGFSVVIPVVNHSALRMAFATHSTGLSHGKAKIRDGNRRAHSRGKSHPGFQVSANQPIGVEMRRGEAQFCVIEHALYTIARSKQTVTAIQKREFDVELMNEEVWRTLLHLTDRCDRPRPVFSAVIPGWCVIGLSQSNFKINMSLRSDHSVFYDDVSSDVNV